MADTKKANRITRSKIRLVEKSKWDLPIPRSKSYWKKVCEDIESKFIKVRNPSPSRPIKYPGVPFLIRSSASSASSDVANIYNLTTRQEPIVETYPPPSPAADSISGTLSESPQPAKFQSKLEEKSNNHAGTLNAQLRITKLTKMTKLVNDFLSSTRTQVRPSSVQTSTSSSQKTDSNKTRKAESKERAKSFEARSKAGVSDESMISTMTSRKNNENSPAGRFDEQSDRKSVVFLENVEEMVEIPDSSKNIVEAKPRRPRAPSLSVASAVPSFGRVVISIESTSSVEDEEENGKTNEKLEITGKLTSTDDFEDDRSNIVDRKKIRDFLKVPEIRTMANNFYPGYDRSISHQRTSLNEIPEQITQIRESMKSKGLSESRVFREKNLVWSRRSILHVFRALKAMKHGTRSKAKIDSDTNKFFAAPMDVYSPTARSSISSDDRMHLVESGSRCSDEYEERDESEENVDGESESSYASIRERLMRNAGTHIEKNLPRTRATRIDGKNGFGATEKSMQALSSNFYNSSSSPTDGAKQRNKNIFATNRYIGLPRMTGIFPRIKADKCLACMCKSLEQINQNERQRAAVGLSNKDMNNVILFEETTSELSDFQCLNTEPFDQSCGLPVFEDDDDDWGEKIAKEDYPRGYSSTSFAGDNEDSTAIETFSPRPVPTESSVGSFAKSSSQLDVSHQSRTVGKSIPKTLINAKSMISSLSVASERSKSISDHDDSDQGCIDAAENDTGMGQGASSKYIAACHMPVNFQPSREPLKALRHKKSRSIRSRVTSAEKSSGSISDDEDDSDNDDNRELAANAGKMKSIRVEGQMKIGDDKSTEKNSVQAISARVNVEADDSRSIDESGENRDGIVKELSKTDSIDGENLENLSIGYRDGKIMSDREVIEIAKKCLDNGKTVAETVRVLAKEYSNRLTETLSQDNRVPHFSNVRKNVKIASNLLTLLADSKSYLNRDNWPNALTHLSFTPKQQPLCNSRKLRRVLPLKSYNLVAPILGMAKWYPKRRTSSVITPSEIKTRHKESTNKTFDLIAITWRPLTERDLEGYDPEATLKMRAAKITDRICEDFCQWMESLGAGTNQTSSITVDVLKDMFEPDFTAEACKSMQMSINEMPMVPDAVAAARNCPRATKLALTRRHLVEDARAERRPKRTVAFGTALPNHLKFVPPRNNVDEKWLQCKNVPTDLETMDAVWKDITHLASVKGFIDWLKSHPRVPRPKALEKTLASKETLVTRQSQEVDNFKDLELDLDQIQSLKVGDNDPHTS